MLPYFERAKTYAEIFKQEFVIPSAQTAPYWIDRLECELSPENLTCDGELHGRALVTKRKELESALQYCHSLQGTSATQGRVTGFELAYGLVMATRRNRTVARAAKLDAAVRDGFLVNTNVILTNGVRGRIIKINRTRVRVQATDGRMWSVPPGCMRKA